MTAPSIVVIGSLNMDIVVSMERSPRKGETLRGEQVHYVPGGKGANQAVGCARLQVDTAMVGCVGDDAFGQRIKGDLAAKGVIVESVEVIEEASTGIAIISHTREDNSIIIIGGANDSCDGAVIGRFEQLIRDAKLVIIQLEIPIETVQLALSIAKQAGVTTILNPAPAQKLPEDVKLNADYMTPNETEWELICGKRCDTDREFLQTISDWERIYGNKVVVTLGDRGCCYVEDGRLEVVAALNVSVVDTTGAGDAFNAAMAYGLIQQPSETVSLRDTLSFAVTSASLSVQTFGAQNGMPTLEAVKKSMS